MRRIAVAVGVILAGGAGVVSAAAVSATTSPPSYVLPANGTLAAGQSLLSPDGHFRVLMKPDGNLVESINGGRTLWSTGTYSHPGSRAFMQVNGDLAVYDTANDVVWSSNSTTAGCPRLIIQDDGNLVIYATAAIWSAASRLHIMKGGDDLQAGWSLYSVNPEDYRLTMLSSGDLVLYDAARQVLWSSGTQGHPGAYAAFQTDGNFVVYSSSGHALWSSATNGHPGSYLDMLGDGNVDIIDAGKVLWRTGTYHKGSGGSISPKAPPPVTCPAPVPPAPPTTVTTPGPVVTVPVTTPVPTPAPKPRALRVRLAISWTWDKATTRLRKARVGSFPGRTELLVQCKGRGCPRRSRRSAHGPRGLHVLLRRLAGNRYRAGDRLLISIQAPGWRSERAEIDFRWGREPRVRLLRT
jgi:hypothetical protein